MGTQFNTSDSFSGANNFNGADLGMISESRWSRWCLTAIGRLGIGGTWEHVSINGSSVATPVGGAPVTSAGGLLAMPTNIGTYNHTGFTLVPQLELKLGYDLTPNLRVMVGYDVIYWSRVARPAHRSARSSTRRKAAANR